MGKGKAVAAATALQGAFGTAIFMPARGEALANITIDRQFGQQ
jgi:hypothetical protein